MSKHRGINVLSLFDGMSGGQMALSKAGIKVDRYIASEVDKYAIKITMKNYPNTEQIGSVLELSDDYLKSLNVDLLIGGSPCQGFSISGKMRGSSTKSGVDVTTLEQYLELKRKGFEFDGQSYLFWEYVRVWKLIKPKYFLLENVRVTKKWLPMFNEAMGVEPILINSSLLSAQNRVRYYWTNIPNVTTPKDKGILLKDILLSSEEVASKYTLSDKLVEGFERHRDRHKERGNGFGFKPITDLNMKAHCITDPGKTRASDKDVLRPCKTREFKESSLCHHSADATDIKGNESIKRVYNPSGKSPTLNTMQGGHREPKVLHIPEATKKGFAEILDGECFDYAMPNSKTRRGRSMKEKSNCLQTSNAFLQYNHPYYRKLTPLECERLQTIPDNYSEGVSNSQRYKMIGNGFTIDVIAHILKNMEIC